MTRIIDKINQFRQIRASSGRSNDKNQNGVPTSWYYSFEFFPPKTEPGLDNLLTRIDRMARRLDPLFIDVTWGSEGSTSARTMSVASQAQRYFGVDVLMHLTTTGMTKESLASILSQAKSCGVHNILALRGDPPRGKQSWEPNDVSGGFCDRAIDLVKLIRELHGDYFGIAVAGHPEGHPSSTSLKEELQHLKEKLDAGADFIISQFFYSVPAFLEFVRQCRAHGITCPIMPGIMPIQSFSTFMRMTKYCGVDIPSSLLKRLDPVKDDDEAVKAIGCEIAAEMCTEILACNDMDIDGVHFYTLNLERSVTTILMRMGVVDLINQIGVNSDGSQKSSQGDAEEGAFSSTVDTVRANAVRLLPWRPSALAQRSKEEVRPINWANRPKSYIMRTEDWDEFPNGRWGDATSPAFGELSDLSHFYSFSLGSEDDRRAMLGYAPTQLQDVYDVFASYVEGKIPHIPWCETPLQAESFVIQKELVELNKGGYLTINSQPAVNGKPSSDKTFGWGGSRGYVYQKEYCECFCSPEHAQALVKMVDNHPNLNLYAVNIRGDEMSAGVEVGGVTALTWGVFPNREILQPTIFDPSVFLVWSEEAFSLWSTLWLSLYEMDSPSYELIEHIRDTHYLVAIIDNDFVGDYDNGSALWRKMLEARKASGSNNPTNGIRKLSLRAISYEVPGTNTRCLERSRHGFCAVDRFFSLPTAAALPTLQGDTFPSSAESRSHFAMDSSDDFVQHRSFKRRRFNMDVSMDGDSENSVNQASFPIHHTQQQKALFASSTGISSTLKRNRSDAASLQQEHLHKVVESQASEIESLKQDKTNLESSLGSLKSEHDKVINENRILKRAVTIQQERQNQAASEIEAARRFKFDAEHQIKKLEQIILSLRYHLQTQQSNPPNDFMGFRPPDVY